ncbi:unnamed protein product [Mytilus coruscus]|uniref:Uncharacterized protein n=1 Tax=Mytilus coruscus TaxID=42192 RepID=A0A6J8AGC0_MYTCO|nr:unnamed protein product [Mytilus coruscus]
MINKIFLEWGSPTIDLFASAQNRKCPVFCAWDQDPTALTQDALSIGWDRMFAYAYPPLSLIPKVLQQMIDYQCEMILIAPFWPKQWWHPQLIQLLIAQPLLLPQWDNLLEQGQGRLKIFHPNPEIFSLTAWRISTNNLKQKAFQKTLENYCPPITSFRRCSDLQALKLGEGSVNIQEKGVTFLRHGLAKQDKANHDNSKNFIPAFPESKLLDPKRTLYMYLKRTDKLRQNGEKQEYKLFLSTNKPHKPVTAQTISHWIVKTIKMAYKQNKKQIGKVRGHSTRSVGPS